MEAQTSEFCTCTGYNVVDNPVQVINGKAILDGPFIKNVTLTMDQALRLILKPNNPLTLT